MNIYQLAYKLIRIHSYPRLFLNKAILRVIALSSLRKGGANRHPLPSAHKKTVQSRSCYKNIQPLLNKIQLLSSERIS